MPLNQNKLPKTRNYHLMKMLKALTVKGYRGPWIAMRALYLEPCQKFWNRCFVPKAIKNLILGQFLGLM